MGVPDILFEDKEIAELFHNRMLTPKHVRNNVKAQLALTHKEIDKDFMSGVSGLAFYNAYTSAKEGSSPIAFERNFNPMLAHDSEYYGTVQNLIKCVEKNSGKGLSTD